MIWWTGLAPWDFGFPFPSGGARSLTRRYAALHTRIHHALSESELLYNSSESELLYNSSESELLYWNAASERIGNTFKIIRTFT